MRIPEPPCTVFVGPSPSLPSNPLHLHCRHLLCPRIFRIRQSPSTLKTPLSARVYQQVRAAKTERGGRWIGARRILSWCVSTVYPSVSLSLIHPTITLIATGIASIYAHAGWPHVLFSKNHPRRDLSTYARPDLTPAIWGLRKLPFHHLHRCRLPLPPPRLPLRTRALALSGPLRWRMHTLTSG